MRKIIITYMLLTFLGLPVQAQDQNGSDGPVISSEDTEIIYDPDLDPYASTDEVIDSDQSPQSAEK